MKLNYDKINANIKALYINNKDKEFLESIYAMAGLDPVSSDVRLDEIEKFAQHFNVSIEELLFGEFTPKYKVLDITMYGGKSKKFYIPIDKFDAVVKMIEEFSDD